MTSIDDIVARVSESYGLVPRDGWADLLEKAAVEVGARTDSNGKGLLGEISRDSATLAKLVGYLTVPETHFMRHGEHFEFLAEHISRRLHGAPETERVRIWSAGCSSGEEPYTVAMILSTRFTPYPDHRIEIMGCDINSKVIEKGKQGLFGAWSFRRTPGWLLQRFFDVKDTGVWRLNDTIRRRVTLEQNTIEGVIGRLSKQSVDVILFRNVGIYLSPEALLSVFSGFRRVLRDDGFLVVAPGDPRPPNGLFTRCDHVSTSVYRPADATARTGRGQVSAVAEKVQTGDTTRERRRTDSGRPAVARVAPAPRKVSQASPVGAAAPSDRGPSVVPEGSAAAAKAKRLEIRQLGDRGELGQALELASALVDRSSSDAEAYLLRGQLHLSGTRDEDAREAIDDFRRAVFLRPEHVLARYWYACALAAEQRVRKARVQLDAVSSLLEGVVDGEFLEDGETTAAELRRAVDFMGEGL